MNRDFGRGVHPNDADGWRTLFFLLVILATRSYSSIWFCWLDSFFGISFFGAVSEGSGYSFREGVLWVRVSWVR